MTDHRSAFHVSAAAEDEPLAGHPWGSARRHLQWLAELAGRGGAWCADVLPRYLRSLGGTVQRPGLWLASGTWALALVGYLALKSTDTALHDQMALMHEQLRGMQAGQRPYVTIKEVGFAAPPSYDASGFNAWMQFVLNNAGHNPATHLMVKMEPMLGAVPGGDQEKYVAEVERNLCSQLNEEIAQAGANGEYLAPGEQKLPVFYHAAIPAEQVARGASLPSMFNGRPTYHIEPSLITCIAYQDAATGDVHHIAYQLSFLEETRSGLANGIYLEDAAALRKAHIEVMAGTSTGAFPPD